VPRICFINKLDRTGADFWRCVAMIKDRLGANAVPIQIPMGSEENFKGVIDLIRNKAIFYRDDLGKNIDVVDIPAEYQAEAKKNRDILVEAVAESDDALTHKFLEGEELTEQEILHGLRLGTLQYRIVPILTGSALKNKGVQPMLDAVVDFLPSPLDIPPVIGEDPRTHAEVVRVPSDNEPFSALVTRSRRIRSSESSRSCGSTPARSRAGRMSTTRRRARRSASAASSRCTPTTARRSKRSTRATSAPLSG